MDTPYTPTNNPQARAADSGIKAVIKHNAHWIWLIVITGLVLWALATIQESRYDQCVNQNKRHDAAIKALKVGSDQDIANAPTVAAKIEIARRRDVTITLIDALAPHQNCDDVVGGIHF